LEENLALFWLKKGMFDRVVIILEPFDKNRNSQQSWCEQMIEIEIGESQLEKLKTFATHLS
jgi:hypothetical protein